MASKRKQIFVSLDVADKYEICKSLIAKWKRNRDLLENAAAQRQKTLKKDKTFTKTQRTFSETPSEVHPAKTKGLKISYAWFYANANKINKEIRGQDTRRLPKSVLYHALLMSTKQNYV